MFKCVVRAYLNVVGVDGKEYYLFKELFLPFAPQIGMKLGICKNVWFMDLPGDNGLPIDEVVIMMEGNSFKHLILESEGAFEIRPDQEIKALKDLNASGWALWANLDGKESDFPSIRFHSSIGFDELLTIQKEEIEEFERDRQKK